jgi:hypothetical protein
MVANALREWRYQPEHARAIGIAIPQLRLLRAGGVIE